MNWKKKPKMVSPLKPIVKTIKILSFLLGNGIDAKKLEKSGGLVFEKSKFGLFKMIFILILPYISSGLLFGYRYANDLR